MSALPSEDDWIVLKFGGTSVSRRPRWDNIGRLMAARAREEQCRVLVVVSALSGVTNDLQALADRGHDDAAAAAAVAALCTRHRAFCGELGIGTEAVDGHLATLEKPHTVSRILGDWLEG